MPESQAKPVTSNAILELDGGVRLTGDLTVLADGRLQLGSARLQKGSAPGGKVSLRPGKKIVLSLPPEAGAESVSVTVAGIAGNKVTLAFSWPDGDEAKSFRDALAGKPRGPAKTAVVAANAQYSSLLETLRAQSLNRLEGLLKPFLTVCLEAFRDEPPWAQAIGADHKDKPSRKLVCCSVGVGLHPVQQRGHQPAACSERNSFEHTATVEE